MANSSDWPHTKCDLGPVGLIEQLVHGAVSARIIAKLTLPGAERAQR